MSDNQERMQVTRREEPRLLRFTGGNGLEVGVLLFAVACLVITVVATVRATNSGRYGDDLTFNGTLQETSSLIKNRGSAGVATYQTGLMQIGSATFPIDSLALSGDSMLFPSLAKGGFLHDQLDLHNDQAARVAIHNLFSPDSVLLAIGTPSVFRLARTDSGYQVLSAELNEYSLTVPSPRRDRQWVTVRTADGRIGPSLVGLFATIDLSQRDSLLSMPRPLSGKDCRIQRRGVARLLYCGSAAGAAVGAAFDLGFDLPDTMSFGTGAKARLARSTSFYQNGVRATTPAILTSGDLLYTRPTGAMVASNTQSGVLAGQQWLNGRNAFTIERSGTIEQLGRIGRGAVSVGSNVITLSLDAALARELDTRVDDFTRRNARLLQDLSVVVADIGTGEVKAISQSGPRDGVALRAFEPLLFGSAVKPILAAAILSQDPALAGLTIPYAGDEVREVSGLPLARSFKNPANGCSGTIDLALFLQCSSNQFAAELFVRSIQRSAHRNDIATGGVVPNALLENTPLTNGLLTLFDDIDVVSSRDPGRTDRIWKHADGTSAMIPRDHSMHPWKSRPWFIDARAQGTSVDLLSRFAFGGWENRWTQLGAAEAYARIATDRRVQLTMLWQPMVPGTFPALPPRAAGAFRIVRNGLARVADGGTADGLGSVYRSIGAPGDSLVVLAKTGTLNEITAQRADDDVFVKSLVVVVGQRRVNQPDAPLRCGLVAVVHMQFRQDWKGKTGGEDSRLPALHREFAEEDLAASLRAAWRRLSPCRLSTL